MPIRYSETVSVYQEVTDRLADGNPVPEVVFLTARSVPCNIHRGTDDLRDAAQMLGISVNKAAYAYLPVEKYALVPIRAVLIDGDNVAWLVRDSFKRSRFCATAHVRCLLQYLEVRPDGLP